MVGRLVVLVLLTCVLYRCGLLIFLELLGWRFSQAHVIFADLSGPRDCIEPAWLPGRKLTINCNCVQVKFLLSCLCHAYLLRS